VIVISSFNHAFLAGDKDKETTHATHGSNINTSKVDSDRRRVFHVNARIALLLAQVQGWFPDEIK